jgi:hypothetical protein
MEPVQIEVFYPVPEGWGMCTACEIMLAQADIGGAPQQCGLDEYPPEWQEDLSRLSSIISDLAGRYQNKVLIRIWHPRSFQGLWYSIRFNIHNYPTLIVHKRYKQIGGDAQMLDSHIQSAMAA